MKTKENLFEKNNSEQLTDDFMYFSLDFPRGRGCHKTLWTASLFGKLSLEVC
jgi:hypothetical protein